MTKKSKFKKDIRQPSITNVFKSNSVEASGNNTGLESMDHDANSQNGKRRRDTIDSNESNTPPTIPVKKDKKIPRMASEGNMEDITFDSTPSLPNTEESTQILSTNDTSNPLDPDAPKNPIQYTDTTIPLPPVKENPTEMDKMELRLTKNMQAMLKPIQETLARMTRVKEKVERHESKIKRLETDNWKLKAEVKTLKQELKDVNKRIIDLENKSLDKNLIFHGIPEDQGIEREDIVSKIYQEISPTINRETDNERLQVASEIEIVKVRRLGKKDVNRTRPISMEFSNKFDVEQIFANRFDLNDGIYVNREYSKETERNRRLLRPILQAAKKLPEYKDVCRMEADVLNLNGTKFNKDNLHELPVKLNIMDITTKSNADVVGFFGEICPLSNFYPSKFLYKGIEFHSSEQFIQHAKATFFGDPHTQNTILNAETALGAKRAGREVLNYDHKRWCRSAKDLCKPGIDAKFCQNPRAMQALLETGDKTLVECTKDAVWGNGYPLGHPNSLRSQTWKSKGILGEILEEIRNHHLAEARSMPWANTRGWQSQHRPAPPPSSHFNAHFPPIHVTTSSPIRQPHPIASNQPERVSPTHTSSPPPRSVTATFHSNTT